jgi:hypothetical protein
MKAFAGLFYEPGKEADYSGYQRVLFDYVDEYFFTPVGLRFPVPSEGTTYSGLQHIGIFNEEGGLLCATALSNPLAGDDNQQPMVILFCNLPTTLNPIARVAYELVLMGKMKAEDLHPTLYETINSVLAEAGIPVIPCRRSGVATMKGKIANMPSLKNLGIELEKAATLD